MLFFYRMAGPCIKKHLRYEFSIFPRKKGEKFMPLIFFVVSFIFIFFIILISKISNCFYPMSHLSQYLESEVTISTYILQFVGKDICRIFTNAVGIYNWILNLVCLQLFNFFVFLRDFQTVLSRLVMLIFRPLIFSVEI